MRIDKNRVFSLHSEAVDVEGFEEGGWVVRFDQDGKPTGIAGQQAGELGEPERGVDGRDAFG
jgi:hypothetical protein